MIIVKLQGGLGNQMFQYAIGRQLSIHFKTTLKVDNSIYRANQFYENITLRSYQLNIFSLKVEEATDKEIHYFTKKKDLFGKARKLISRAKIIQESSFLFDPNFKAYGPNCYLIGYWQSELYFKEIAKVIREDFSFKMLPVNENSYIADRIISANSVSMHIRRGDYQNNPTTKEFHGLCSIEYYQRAIKLMNEKVGNPHFFVFSDDMNWVRNNIRINGQHTFVDINDENNGNIDMQLMSLCKHNIIANSSFSWWGAWLNSYNKKIVIAPEKWFNNSSIDTSTILPVSWYKL